MKFLLIISITLLFVACRNEKDEANAADSATLVVPDSLLVYDVNAEAKTKKPYTEIPADSITVQHVINGLNAKYAEVQMQLVKTSNDTLYVSFADNGEYVGERMGSAGSSSYMADAVLNLTGVKGVNYVKFEMQRHSHVSPGVLGKENFEEFKEIQ
jgi:ABC-type Fe3+-hydroxamate transport system substrate-binding protein